MKTNPSATLGAFWLGLLLLSCSLPLRAEQSGLFTYEVVNGSTVTVTAYPSNATGPVEIPAEIAGKPVTIIGHSAFSGCTGLTRVTIPSSVTSIGESAFYGCTALTSVTIPSSVTSIGESAFEGCPGLTSIHVEAGNPAYASDGGVLLDAARTLLIRCPQGKAGSYSIPSSVTSIQQGVFYRCTRLTSVTIPSSVTSIGGSAFYGCTGLTSVNNIASSVTSIGDSTFASCTGLTSVTIPSSVTSIGESAFRGCTGLTSVAIPSGVTIIGRAAFRGCTGLTSVTVPSSVTSIGESAFSGCSGLTNVTIPSSVTGIGGAAFYGCTGLTSVNVVAGNPAYASDGGVLLDAARTLLIRCPQGKTESYSIPSNVTSIGESAFEGCSGLTNVTIPSSVTGIGGAAFYGCTGLTSVIIPSSVTWIGQSAFSGCTGLTSINVEAGNPAYASDGGVLLDAARTLLIRCPQGKAGSYSIPSSVTGMEPGAFASCTRLTSIHVEAGNPAYASDGGVLLDAARTLLIRCPQGKAGSYSIPSSVTSIGQSAFEGCPGLTSVAIPSSVTFIGGAAFYGCTGLTSVNIATSVTSIGDLAFASCSGLTSVTIPFRVTGIGRGAFRGCTGLTSVTVPSSVTSIGESAFEGCTGLTGINVEAGNPAYASDGGVLLNAARTLLIRCPQGKAGSYSIPSSVAGMEPGAFSGCTGLTSVAIPSSVTSIGQSAFSGCTGLTSVTIPSSVTRIGECISDEGYSLCVPAFDGCTAMTRMVFLGHAPATVSGDFEGAAPGFTIYYLSSRSGFTSPAWRGHPATMINETTYPAAAWLLEHGLWHDTGLHTDSDGDGVDLLMAYALNLNPHQNLQASLPVPVLSESTLSLNFHATAPGVIYRAETSTDLTNWTTAGITQSAPGPDGRSTAAITFDAPRRFLRLTVED